MRCCASEYAVRAMPWSQTRVVRHGPSEPGTLSSVRHVLALAVALVLAAPAQAAFRPGERAAIGVSVATLWKAPNLARSIDRPSLTNPVDPAQWSRNLATTDSRVWLDSHVQTQALYGQQVVVLA